MLHTVCLNPMYACMHCSAHQVLVPSAVQHGTRGRQQRLSLHLYCSLYAGNVTMARKKTQAVKTPHPNQGKDHGRYSLKKLREELLYRA
mmetsp:Transcript_22530/g.62250  ORF Transcript_22530/g.62250 Transcript_22530/m.62250 type:complete len:89 (-) Transcript_22530:1821-2087(-)